MEERREIHRLTVRVLGLVQSVSNLHELLVHVAQSSLDSLLDGESDGLLDESRGERSENLIGDIVLRLSDLEREGVDLSVDVLDEESVIFPLSGRLESHVNGETVSGEKDCCERE